MVKINANVYGPMSKGLNLASNSSLRQGIVEHCVPKNVLSSLAAMMVSVCRKFVLRLLGIAG